MSAGLTVLIALGTLVAFVLAMGAVWAFGTANRLDRLHVRYDLSWQALDSALARRAGRSERASFCHICYFVHIAFQQGDGQNRPPQPGVRQGWPS